MAKVHEWQQRGNHPTPMSDTSEETTCLNCSTTFVGNYCPHCGQSAKVKRLTIAQGVSDLIGIFTNFDSGFFHTCWELIYRPGYMIRDFLNGHRKEYIKPLQLIFILATIMTVMHFIIYGNATEPLNLTLDERDANLRQFQIIVHECLTWLWENQAILFLLITTMLVVPNRICFSIIKNGRTTTLSEHFFVMAYVGCQMLMLEILQMPIDYLTSHSSPLDLGIPLLLIVYDFHQFYQISFRKSVALCLLSSLLALALFAIIVTTLALSLDHILGIFDHDFEDLIFGM